MQKFSFRFRQKIKENALARTVFIDKLGAAGICLGAAVYAPAIAIQKSKPVGAIECKLEKVQDNQRSGGPAFTVFVPKGWTSENSFTWQNNNGYFAHFFASSPDHYSVDISAPLNMNRVAYPGAAPTGPRLTSAGDYLRKVVGDWQQKGATNIQVVKETDDDLPLEEWEKPMKLLPDVGRPPLRFHRHGQLKVTFEVNGTAEQATLETTVAGVLAINHTMLGIGPTARPWDTERGIYVVGPTIVVVTPADPSPIRIKEAQIFASTPAMTPEFKTYCAKLRAQMASDALKVTGEVGKAQIEMMRQHTDDMMSEFRSHMADRDANVHDFKNYILDQADYKGRDGRIVTIPYMFDHSYANGQGGYILNSDPTFDPRGYGSGGYVPMVKTMHGQ